VGADGVIFVLRDKENFQMRIYNSDGSEPEVSCFSILEKFLLAI
jgi:diaminopimelate epimerase